MTKLILALVLLVSLMLTLKGKSENFKLRFPENNNVKCKCKLDKKNKETKKQIERFSNYDNSEPEIKPKIDNRHYIIYDPPNDIVTAENFYLNKIKKYPLSPSNENTLYDPSNITSYDNIGLSSTKILDDNFSKNLDSHKFTYGIMYEN